MTKETLVLDVKPDGLTSYGNLLVAFFDKELEKAKTNEKGKKILDEDGEITLVKVPVLYIHIQSSKDKYQVTKRKASTRRNKAGQVAEEKQLFARAYEKYLTIKQNGGFIDAEKAALIKRVAELEANAPKRLKKVELKKTEPKKVEEIKPSETVTSLTSPSDEIKEPNKGN